MQNYRTETLRGPFGDRDCWPATGPIYGFLDADECPRRAKRGFWQRWLAKDNDNEDQVKSGPVSPIHY